MKVTMAHLELIGAPQPARKWFRATYGEGAVVPLAQVLHALVESEDGLYWADWYFSHGNLPAPAYVVYQEASTAAEAAARGAIAAAGAAYRGDTASAYVVYQEAISAALAAYQEAHRLAALAAADACEA